MQIRTLHLIIFLVTSVFLAESQDLSQLKQQPAFKIRGGIDLRGISYNAVGMTTRYPKTSYMLTGSPVVSIYGVNIPMSFSVSNQGANFRQPFNQFGLSPTYKKITVHAGYRNINFSPFTLGGHTMLGGGFEANPGKLRLGLMYGRINKATAIDPTSLSIQPVTFGRKGLGGKLGFGTNKNYFDITFLKAADDFASIPSDTLKKLEGKPTASVFAAENLSTGMAFKFELAKNLIWDGDAAGSLYTRDQRSDIVLTDSSGILNILKNIVNVNGTSGFYTALQTGLRYKAKNYGLKLQYRRIDPNYRTMGTYFFQNDIQNITIGPNFNALKGKIRFTGSVGVQTDNLKKLKAFTSKKIIGSANLSADFTESFGVDFTYSNFSNNQTLNVTNTNSTSLSRDSLKITQTTQNISISPRLLLVGSTLTHSVMLSANLMQLQDLNTQYAADDLSRNMDSQNLFLNYSLTFNEQNMTVFANLNNTTLTSTQFTDNNRGITLGVNKSLIDNKLNINASGGFLLGSRGVEKSNIINSSAQINYNIYKGHRLSLNANYLSNTPTGEIIATGTQKYSELRAEIGYGFSF